MEDFGNEYVAADIGDAPSESDKSESGTQTHEANSNSASDSDEARDSSLPWIDEQYDRIGFGRFHRRCLIISCLILTSLGSEYTFGYLLPQYLSQQLDSSPVILEFYISLSCFGLGLIMGGIIADRHGRHGTLLASGIVTIVSTLCRAISPDWYMLRAMHSISEISSGCELPIVLAWTLEVIPSSWRSKSVILLMGSGIFVGSLYISLVHFLIVLFIDTSKPNDWWRFLIAMSVLPHIVSTCILWSNTPESPRWLLTKGRRRMCTSLLQIIAEENKTESQLIANGEVKPGNVLDYDASFLNVLTSTSVVRLSLMSFLSLGLSWFLSWWVFHLTPFIPFNSIVSKVWDNKATVTCLQPLAVAVSIFLSSNLDLCFGIVLAYSFAGCLSFGIAIYSPSSWVGVALNQILLCLLFISATQTLSLAVASFPTAFRCTLIGSVCCIAGMSCLVGCALAVVFEFALKPYACYLIMATFEIALSVGMLQLPRDFWTKAAEEWPESGMTVRKLERASCNK